VGLHPIRLTNHGVGGIWSLRAESGTTVTSSGVPCKLRRTTLVAGAAVYAAMYVSLVEVFQPVSYAQFQLRIANVLVGLIPLMGWAGIVGQTAGVFISNISSPLGPVDMLNAIPTMLFSIIIWKTRRVSVLLGFLLYSVGLGASVSVSLNYAVGLPWFVTMPYVSASIFFVTGVFGYVLYHSVKRLGVLQRYFGT
jgi:uncharacterized membrane protein